MYLFLLASDIIAGFRYKIYIPKCIYFYNTKEQKKKLSRIFTFQNVSISTGNRRGCSYYLSRFTFQNVSISTVKNLLRHRNGALFTFQNVSISTGQRTQDEAIGDLFTFQNVSISTAAREW